MGERIFWTPESTIPHHSKKIAKILRKRISDSEKTKLLLTLYLQTSCLVINTDNIKHQKVPGGNWLHIPVTNRQMIKLLNAPGSGVLSSLQMVGKGEYIYEVNDFPSPPIVKTQEHSISDAGSVPKVKIKRHWDFISYWYKAGLKKHKGTDTLVYRKDIQALGQLKRGTFFNQFSSLKEYHNTPITLVQWKRAVDHLKLAAFDDKYQPLEKGFLRRLSINEFLYQKYTHQKTSIRSWFIVLLENPPRRIQLQDDHPILTNCLIEEFKKHKSNGWKPNKGEIDIFITSSAKVFRWFKDNDRHISPYEHELRMVYMQAKLVVDAVAGNSDKIEPHWLLADSLYSNKLRQHLERLGVWYN